MQNFIFLSAVGTLAFKTILLRAIDPLLCGIKFTEDEFIVYKTWYEDSYICMNCLYSPLHRISGTPLSLLRSYTSIKYFIFPNPVFLLEFGILNSLAASRDLASLHLLTF